MKRTRRRSRFSGSGGSAGRCSQGRQQVGGDVVALLELQGLRQEVKTLSSLPPIWSRKERRLRWMTLVGAVVKRRERQRSTAAADPDSVRGPQVRRQILWQLPVCCNVVSRQGRIV